MKKGELMEKKRLNVGCLGGGKDLFFIFFSQQGFP